MLRDVFLCVNLIQVKGYVEGCVFCVSTRSKLRVMLRDVFFCVCQLEPS